MVPWARIDTVFLDVGNTLISIDFDWVAAELTSRGRACAAEDVRRAEAAARPGYSRRLFVDGIEPGADLFRYYLHTMLARLEVTASLARHDFDALLTELRKVLRPDGRASVLWRMVMPRVPEALARLRDLGLTLVVVSNSDGTVERSLEEARLRPFLTTVVDSAIAGYEKPDPRIFEAALAHSGARRETTLHVGDLYHADVAGARGAGIHAVLLDPYDDWRVDDVDRLPDLWAVAERLASRDQDGSDRG
jgi:HAD superfamily hydrolase (TIGR01509 family)